MAEETTPATAEKKPNTTMGLLCYLGILVLVPLFSVKAEDRDDFLKTHLRQGIGLLITMIIVNVIRTVVSGSTIASLIASVIAIFFFILAIIGIVNAVKAKDAKLPFLGDLFDKIGNSMIK
ncbi:MAG: hypothetical protein IKR94_03420 [Bacteroidales bacterium]|nr:hypothetical protein [Bacteroidales bacterium]MBR4214348.1 hypothetical protein [Bacteroidales bacterium]